MRCSSLLTAAAILCLPACGSSDVAGTPAPADLAFNPPAPPEGYTRLETTTVKDVKPGGDVTYCEYVMAPFDHDVDVLDVQGYQSAFGHHAIAFSYTPTGNEELGASFPCMGTEFSSGVGGPDGGSSSGGTLSMGAFLGGVAGADGKRSAPLPDGVAFRLRKGSGVMANVHYLNTGEKTIDGNAVLDMKFADVDPNRMVAAMFLTLNFGFDLPPHVPTSSSVQCVAGNDVHIIMMANHMHEFGTSVTTEIVRGDTGAVDTLHDDPAWNYDMQFNLQFSRWEVATPFVIHTGDTVRTTCNWTNSTANEMKFPREMCVGVGFALVQGTDTKAPACAGGTWMPQFL